MNILYLTHRMPWPPNRGDKLRSYHMIRELSKFHTVSLLSFYQSRKEYGAAKPHLLRFSRQITGIPLNRYKGYLKGIVGMLLGRSITVSAFQNADFRKYLRLITKSASIDLVIADSSALAVYPLIDSIPFVADFMDVDSDKWEQYAKNANFLMKIVYHLEARTLAQVECKCIEKAKKVLVVSQKEKEKLSASYQDKVEVVPNGVDTGLFKPGNGNEIPKQLIFTGVLDYLPNIDALEWFSQEIWPKIVAQIPDAKFLIVGANPTAALLKLKSQKGIEIHSNVESVQPYFDRAEIAVVPVRYSIGLLNKVIEAMAMGKAVVATSGAVNGLLPEVQNGVLKADTAEDFAAAVIKLLKDPQKRAEYSRKGPKLVQKYCNWERNLSKFVHSL